ncbi:MAG: peptidoglycan DD-metalloendopeptidase family protein [Rhodospirillales bacterium]|nr:MAG: peptidoglycan DD-metalloendopeptidase family protein [Rhodospirillales bacterium]
MSTVSQRLLWYLALTAALLLPISGAAADPGDLEQVERQLQADRDRAAALERERKQKATEVNSLRRQAIAAAKKAQRHEAELVALEERLAELNARERDIRDALSRRRYAMSGTLAALQRLSRRPPQTLLAFPDAPTRMARSGMLLQVALPRIRDEADRLAAMLDELAGVREETRLRLASVTAETTALEAEQERLAGILRRKSVVLKQTESERREVNRRVDELARKAKSIRELLAQIEAERLAREAAESERRAQLAAQQAAALGRRAPERPGPAGDLAKPAGIRPFPANGPITDPTSARIVLYYGQRNKLGQTERGITYATRPGAQIVAPHDGRVAFAGPFESYGQILIIEHDGGYHTLLAGLERLDTSVGQWVLAGEPVGAMGETSLEGAGLYLELRRDGQPINPQRWIANAQQNRTSG